MDFKAETAMALFNTATQLYGGYKSYESQKEASELQYEASQEQTKTAGLQEAQAAQQEIAAVEQQRINEMNTLSAASQNAREEQNLRDSQSQATSEARARAAASGIVMNTGSSGEYLSEQENVFGSERDWLRKANESEIDAMKAKTGVDRQVADMAADSTRIAAQGTRAGAAMTEAGASSTEAGAYGSLVGTSGNIWDIGSRTNWYGLTA